MPSNEAAPAWALDDLVDAALDERMGDYVRGKIADDLDIYDERVQKLLELHSRQVYAHVEATVSGLRCQNSAAARATAAEAAVVETRGELCLTYMCHLEHQVATLKSALRDKQTVAELIAEAKQDARDRVAAMEAELQETRTDLAAATEDARVMTEALAAEKHEHEKTRLRFSKQEEIDRAEMCHLSRMADGLESSLADSRTRLEAEREKRVLVEARAQALQNQNRRDAQVAAQLAAQLELEQQTLKDQLSSLRDKCIRRMNEMEEAAKQRTSAPETQSGPRTKKGDKDAKADERKASAVQTGHLLPKRDILNLCHLSSPTESCVWDKLQDEWMQKHRKLEGEISSMAAKLRHAEMCQANTQSLTEHVQQLELARKQQETAATAREQELSLLIKESEYLLRAKKELERDLEKSRAEANDSKTRAEDLSQRLEESIKAAHAASASKEGLRRDLDVLAASHNSALRKAQEQTNELELQLSQAKAEGQQQESLSQEQQDHWQKEMQCLREHNLAFQQQIQKLERHCLALKNENASLQRQCADQEGKQLAKEMRLAAEREELRQMSQRVIAEKQHLEKMSEEIAHKRECWAKDMTGLKSAKAAREANLLSHIKILSKGLETAEAHACALEGKVQGCADMFESKREMRRKKESTTLLMFFRRLHSQALARDQAPQPMPYPSDAQDPNKTLGARHRALDFCHVEHVATPAPTSPVSHPSATSTPLPVLRVVHTFDDRENQNVNGDGRTDQPSSCASDSSIEEETPPFELSLAQARTKILSPMRTPRKGANQRSTRADTQQEGPMSGVKNKASN